MKLFRAALVLAMTVPIILAGHAGAAAQAWTASYNYKLLNGTHLVSVPLTRDAGDQLYTINERTNNVLIKAPITNTGGNTRELFWPANAPDVMDSMSCAVWSKQTDASGQPAGGITQQGAALRVVQTPTGTRGMTVTKNIWYGATWYFNIHVWDTSINPAFTQLAGFDMSEVVGKLWWDEQGQLQSTLKPLPWHVCARTVGNMFQIKVWTNEELTQPSWNDPKYVREIEIPEAWNQPGKAGWYIGHLEPGHSAVFQGLRTWYR